MKIVVLAGGLSPERDVSLSSASLIANALIENGHDVRLVDLFLGETGASGQAVYCNRGSNFRYSYKIPEAAPDLAALRAAHPEIHGPIGPGVMEACRAGDAVFVALHGDIGENGQLQALLDVHGVRYSGSGYIGCLLAMDKDIAKKLVVAAGLATAAWSTYDLSRGEQPSAVDQSFPCVVKPLSCGSSVGISIVADAAGLEKAVNEAAVYETHLLVEKKIEGREFSCGVLDGQALPVIEILPSAGFYDYKNKYQAGCAREICPAELGPEPTRLIQEAALKAHRALRLGFYSRSDFILAADGVPYYLESNTLPGMTPTSLLPQEAAAAGITYRDLVEKIIRSAVR
jgi:D-alanine-D-alanine ligase